jgi:ribose/xylose/arabinose/galactoside ABC-type transport system permease subunit
MKRAEITLAWTLLIGSLVGWPLSMLTWAKDEPPFILSLSWLAITLTAADLLKSSRIHRDQDDAD